MKKKATQATPNLLLRRARLERGWTQKIVAEHIGAPNDVIVTRWERGTAFPSPHYIEQLCRLFGQRASELGLLRDSRVVVSSPHVPFDLSSPGSPDLPLTSVSQQVPPFSALPLIGREADMRVLKALYRDVQQGQMQVVVIQGETGIGKTRLASSFLDWAATQGATILNGRAFEMWGKLPYQPLVHALGRRLEKEYAPEALLSTTWLSELSRILPELRERYPYLPEVPGDEMTARIRLFEAVTRLGQAFCERGPVVLCIDDAHWTDAATLDVLHYAGQRWRESGMPLLLLLSICSKAMEMFSSINRWIMNLHHVLPVTDITPGPLTLEETRHLLATLIPRQVKRSSQRDYLNAAGQWLFRETGGQPFYLVETLKDLLERQILTLRTTSQGEELELDIDALSALQHQSVLPAGVRWLILSQVERLTPIGRALLMASVVLEQAASFDLLCRVANLEERDALAALEEVLRHGLLREVSEESSRDVYYLPGHYKIREVVIAEMGEAQRQLLHRRAFEVLEEEAWPAAELAQHALMAGLTEQAVRFSLAAGDEAVRLFAKAEAQMHYSQALEILSQLSETTAIRQLRAETLLKLVQVSWMAVDVEHTLQRLAEAEALAEARELAHPALDQKLLVSIHYWISIVYGTRHTIRQARSYAERVLAEAHELKDKELVALASLQLSRALALQGQYGPIEGLLTPIIPVLERTGNRLAWTDAQGYLGIALAARGRCAEGIKYAQRSIDHAYNLGEIKSHYGIRARHLLSTIYMFSNDLSHMLEVNDQVVEEAGQIDDWLLLYWAYGTRSWAQGRLGRHEEAFQSMARAQAAGSHLGEQLMGHDIFEAITAELLLATGRVEEALARARDASEFAREEVSGLLGEGIAERVQGQALAHLSRWEEAQGHLATSVQALLAGESLLEAARTHVAWGLLCLDHNEKASAQAHFEQACDQFEVSGLTRDYEIVQGYLSRVGKCRLHR